MSSLAGRVAERFERIMDPCSVAAGNAMNIVEMGLIEHIEIDSDVVHVHMRLTSPTCPMLEHFAREMNEVLGDVRDEIGSVVIHPDTGMGWTPDRMSADAQQRRKTHLLSLAQTT